MDKKCNPDLTKGKSYCLRLLSLCPRTEHELRSRLKNSGYKEPGIDRILDTLKGAGLVDDLKFALEWVELRMGSSPRGARLLETELRNKGVPGTVIEEVVKKAFTVLDERTVAIDLVKEKMRGYEGISDNKLKGKLFQFLLRRGFEEEMAEEAINEVTTNS